MRAQNKWHSGHQSASFCSHLELVQRAHEKVAMLAGLKTIDGFNNKNVVATITRLADVTAECLICQMQSPTCSARYASVL